MQGHRPNRPLMINNLHCQKALFRDYVTQACLAINDTNMNALDKWQEFIIQMQGIIKITGKWYAHKCRKDTEKQTLVLQTLRQKANHMPLSAHEEAQLTHAVKVLNQ